MYFLLLFLVTQLHVYLQKVFLALDTNYDTTHEVHLHQETC